MSKITLSHLTNLQNEATAVNTLNANSDTIVSSFDNTLSRDGTSPNQMMSPLDMNNNQIINLPTPTTATSPARLQDVTTSTVISSIPPVGTSGAVVGFLNGNNTHSGNNTFTGTDTFSSLTTNFATINTAVFKGFTSGSTDIQANAVASGILTLPTSNDTLIGKATADTLTNKTYDTAGTGNVFKINGTSISATTGTGSVVLATSPTIISPVLGVASATSLTAAGFIKSSSASAGIGYATGAGTAVPQLTNKNTTVVSNTPSGQITMASTALAPGATATFTVSCASCLATDIPIIVLASGFTSPIVYNYFIGGVTNGSFTIYVKNISGAATLSEALVFNYVLIKGVNS